ncbi:hypothetical protein [Pelagicoccus sp. SDUM812002]|uniref:hypothetical protein n=1 Tax=Pelagicoccus sp. SDUM812002 TaxID=3041266 RepID=UPI00280F5E6F|nr:hypothetical protein [Pelagicoccus sp. SDUM812002]MDQ8185799.1 hypothetical protein [Pelagicoccus sp. SDUM812002]
MKAKIAIPLLAITAVVTGIIGVASGLFFLVAFSVVGLLAAVVGGIWSARKLNQHSGSQS